MSVAGRVVVEGVDDCRFEVGREVPAKTSDLDLVATPILLTPATLVGFFAESFPRVEIISAGTG